MGDWRKMHTEELPELYSPNIIRMIKSRNMRWAGHVARAGEMRLAYMVVVGEPEGKSPLGRPRRRWEDNIKVFKIVYCRRYALYNLQDVSRLCRTSIFRSSCGVSFILTLWSKLESNPTLSERSNTRSMDSTGNFKSYVHSKYSVQCYIA